MAFVLALLLASHGVLHLLGFLRAFDLASIPLSGRTLIPLSPRGSQVLGVGWLLAALLLFGAAALSLARPAEWWALGAVALVASQLLIVIAWPDAKAGTVINLLLLVPCLSAFGASRFFAQLETEKATLLLGADRPGMAVTQSELEPLPPPIRRWLEQAGVVGRPRPQVVHLKQRGGMRTQKDADFSSAQAEQWFRIEPPGFLWQVELQMMGLPILGRDRYQDGAGHMWITTFGLFTLVNGRGPQIDQGTALRFLGELVWFPSAALSPRIRWEPIDDRWARAHFSDRGLEVSADFEIDEKGQFLRLTARRYMGAEADAKLELWEVPATAWGRFQGVEVPTKGQVVWRLKDGDFEYYRWEITALEFDPAGPGGAPAPAEVVGRSL
ncbi:MAG: hypothetical protein IPG45_13385 [Deltaproteobacteria bacterium]|jgi:hypothetical protein|nr:hypothetical protein [Deltaproteobacteria bacterium]